MVAHHAYVVFDYPGKMDLDQDDISQFLIIQNHSSIISNPLLSVIPGKARNLSEAAFQLASLLAYWLLQLFLGLKRAVQAIS